MNKILKNTAEIKAMLHNAPSSADFGEVKIRLNSLPTTPKMVALIVISIGAMTIITKWHDTISLVQ